MVLAGRECHRGSVPSLPHPTRPVHELAQSRGGRQDLEGGPFAAGLSRFPGSKVIGGESDEQPEPVESQPPAVVVPEGRRSVAGRQRGPIHVRPVAAEHRYVTKRAAAAGVTEVDQPGHDDRRILAGGDEDVIGYQITVARCSLYSWSS